MSDIAIRVENLSKQYHIGRRYQRHDTVADQLAHALSWPVRKARSLFGTNGISKTPAPEYPPSKQGSSVIWALKDVSFEVKQGEVIGIIGRNGAGKSTLLKLLTRITEPTGGRAELFGRVKSLLEVGTGFHPELTGRENIYLNGAILGMRKAEIQRKFDEIVDFAEIEKFIDTPVKRYSSGMYVRLAFAVAAHLEPEILLVDEVLAVGDVAFQKKCLGKMGTVAREGRTILFVSHNMEAMVSLTTRSLWLDNGQISLIGNTPYVVESYLTGIETDSLVRGFASLTAVDRSETVINPKAQFQWIRTRDKNGNQTDVVVEGEPLTVELGFKVLEESKNLEFGIGVASIKRRTEDLFLIPSPLYSRPVVEGNYSVRMTMDPNYLRAGSYTLVTKMFVDGVRQETLGDSLRFRILENRPRWDDDRSYKIWLSGFFKFDYQWERIEAHGQWIGAEEACCREGLP